jgi:voltage-gated potassium channel
MGTTSLRRTLNGAPSTPIGLRQLVSAITVLAALTAVGTAGYVLIEGAAPFDALYMTVITLSTVGYGETIALSTPGRAFTLVMIVFGVGAALYLLTAIGQLVWEGRLRELIGRRAMDHRIERLNGHVIVCGYGRLGRVVVDEMRRSGTPVVVIDVDPAVAEELTDTGIPHIAASALADSALEQADIRRARAIAVATGSDADNVFIALSAKELHPGIRVHARAESDAGMRHLRLAGADCVLSAYQAGGLRLAASILRPTVVDLLEIDGTGHAFDVGEVRVEAASAVLGQRVHDVEAALGQLRIVALRSAGGDLSLVPSGDTVLTAGDHLVVVGAKDCLGLLALRAQRDRDPANRST